MKRLEVIGVPVDHDGELTARTEFEHKHHQRALEGVLRDLNFGLKGRTAMGKPIAFRWLIIIGMLQIGPVDTLGDVVEQLARVRE